MRQSDPAAAAPGHQTYAPKLTLPDDLPAAILNAGSLDAPQNATTSAQRALQRAKVKLASGHRDAARAIAIHEVLSDPNSADALAMFCATLQPGDRITDPNGLVALSAALSSARTNGALVQIVACNAIYASLHEIADGGAEYVAVPPQVFALATTLLYHGSVRHLGLETVLVGLRRRVLEGFAQGGALTTDDTDFAESLARHSFSCEYIWSVSEAENQILDALQRRLVAALTDGANITASELYLLGAYRDLAQIPAIRAWVAQLASQPSQPIDPTLKLIVLDRLIEGQLRDKIPSLTPVTNETSLAVRAQYEDNPYPRWRSLPAVHPVDYLTSIRQAVQPNAPDLGAPEAAPRVLIAGCGTGLHPITCALTYKNAQILAVDLSRSSLAYATREAHARGISNIAFAQGDILEFGAMGPTFDIVESAGVIHHMAEPEAGLAALVSTLKPGGLLFLGLYSRLARGAVNRARQVVAERGFASDLPGLRRFREDYCAGLQDEIGPLANVQDFYSASDLRDLVFHVQEHQFSVPQIADLLARHDLSFLGFEDLPPEVRRRYAQLFPKDPSQTNLENWAQFEAENPQTFICMYKFWSQNSAI